MQLVTVARHPGPGSGCQGCDPAVSMPTNSDRIFLCALCIRWMELHYFDTRPDLAQIGERRRALKDIEVIPA